MAAEQDELITSEFNWHHLTLISEEQEEGWQAEICRYLKDLPVNITRNTDIIAWWQVCVSHILIFPHYLLFSGKQFSFPNLLTPCFRFLAMPGILRCMWTFIFEWWRNCCEVPCVVGCWPVWGTTDHKICMVGQHWGSCMLEFILDGGGRLWHEGVQGLAGL